MKQYIIVFVHLLVHYVLALPQCDENYVGKPRFCSRIPGYSESQFPQPRPCEVTPKFVIRQLLRFYPDEQIFSLMADLLLEWKDSRVTLEGNKTSGWLSINDKSPFWTPSIHFPSAISVEKLSEKFGFFNNGTEETERFLTRESMILKMTCEMNLTSVPFDHQECDVQFVAFKGNVQKMVFKPSIILTKNEEIKSGSVPFTPKVKPIKASIDEFGYSQAGIHFALIRKHRDMEYLLGSFYLPSALFAVISLASFCIKPDTVPGRMGMIITLFLILINTYTSVAAPNGRGFSYIEVWYIGIQVPIVFAFLEYGIILYVMRKRSLGTVLHFGKCALTLDTLIFRVDQVSFVISSIYIAVFIAVYRQKALEIWVENEQRITHG